MQHNLLPTRTTAASSLKQVLMLACASALLAACDVDDVTDIFENGIVESYTIVNNDYGTLVVDEPFEDYVASYTIDDNPYGINRIEFTADGTYHIAYSAGAYDVKAQMPDEQDDVPAINIPIDSTEVAIPFRLLAKSGQSDMPSTGKYQYENGHYVIPFHDSELSGDSLTLTDDEGITRSYAATPDTLLNMNYLSNRLSHTWVLTQVVVKIYNWKNLYAIYHMSDWEIRNNCIDTFVITRYGHFYRYNGGQDCGNGNWSWAPTKKRTLNLDYSSLADSQDYYYYASMQASYNNTVYFADNHMYLYETYSDFDATDWKLATDSYYLYLNAICLYQFTVKGAE